jgi:hypothetical protein
MLQGQDPVRNEPEEREKHDEARQEGFEVPSLGRELAPTLRERH